MNEVTWDQVTWRAVCRGLGNPETIREGSWQDCLEALTEWFAEQDTEDCSHCSADRINALEDLGQLTHGLSWQGGLDADELSLERVS